MQLESQPRCTGAQTTLNTAVVDCWCIFRPPSSQRNCQQVILYYYGAFETDNVDLLTTSQNMRVAIIGAGPAGLVTCKTMLEAATDAFPFDPVIFEQQEDLGGTFRYRSYEVIHSQALMQLNVVLNMSTERPASVFEAAHHLF